MERSKYKKVIGENLQSIRKSHNLTTVDVAKIIGVSQAKISYIENCKGDLTAEEIALLARRLNIPVTDFFRGLTELISERDELINHLVRFGATLLAKPSGIPLKDVPFEEVFAQSLGFVEDERFRGGLYAALITQTENVDINIDRIFALIGNNDFLIRKAGEEAINCLHLLDLLTKDKIQIRPRAAQQLNTLLATTKDLLKGKGFRIASTLSTDDLSDIATFVGNCIHTKK